MCKENGICTCANKCDKCKELIKQGLLKDGYKQTNIDTEISSKEVEITDKE